MKTARIYNRTGRENYGTDTLGHKKWSKRYLSRINRRSAIRHIADQLRNV